MEEEFFKMDYELLERTDLSADEKLFIAYVKDYGTKGVYMPHKEISDILGGASEPTIRKLLKGLTEKNIIRIEKKGLISKFYFVSY